MKEKNISQYIRAYAHNTTDNDILTRKVNKAMLRMYAVEMHLKITKEY